jgi:2-iminobutanoate/2-iminopropanoate deaminase
MLSVRKYATARAAGLARLVVTYLERPDHYEDGDPAMDIAPLPFSPTRTVDSLVFLSGQGGFVPGSGELAGSSIGEQTEQTLRNVAALLGQHHCTLADVVSCLVHLSDLNDFPRFNEVYAAHFPEPRPVRTTVGAPLVAGMLVEITVVAHTPREE